MKKQATDLVRDAQKEDVDDIKARRTRFIVTHLLIFLACLLVSLCIWLVVHYTKSGTPAPATAELSESVILSDDRLI